MRAVGELFNYLVSKKVESIDGLQSSFSQAHRAVKIRNTENYTSPVIDWKNVLSVPHLSLNASWDRLQLHKKQISQDIDAQRGRLERISGISQM